MKKWLRNMKEEDVLISIIIGSLRATLISSVLSLGQNGEQVNHLFLASVIFFSSISVTFGILLFMVNSTNLPQKTINKETDGVDISFMGLFLARTKLKNSSIVAVLKEIERNTLFLSSRMNDLAIEEQHHFEQMVSRRLKELLFHYESMSAEEKDTYENELIEALHHVNETLEDEYVNVLRAYHVQQFQKTSRLIQK